VHTGQKQRVGIFSGQRLGDYIKYQVDYTMYKSTNKGYKLTNRAYDVCVCVFKAFNILINITKHIHSHNSWEVLSM